MTLMEMSPQVLDNSLVQAFGLSGLNGIDRASVSAGSESSMGFAGAEGAS